MKMMAHNFNCGRLLTHKSGLARLELWPKALASGSLLRLLATTIIVAVTPGTIATAPAGWNR